MRSCTNTREEILEAGYRLISRHGFIGVGLAQILAEAGVPKGSFYYYFKSKEHFGQDLIDHYFASYLETLDSLLDSTRGGTAYQRLMGYWHRWLETQSANCDARKCLVVKLSAEISDLSESMRLAMASGVSKITKRLTLCIEEGQRDGSICSLPSQDTAEFLYNLWLGASLTSKLYHDDKGLLQALRATELILTHNRFAG